MAKRGISRKPDDTIWALLDPKPGTANQCLAVADALGLPYREISLAYNALAKLPNVLLGASCLGLTKPTKASMGPPWPDMVIAAGRRTAPVARRIKALSGGRTKLVQIMDPGGAIDDFDLVAIPDHDAGHQTGDTVIHFTGAPHRVTPKVLAAARKEWQSKIRPLKHPVIALLVGGPTRRRPFGKDAVRDLAGSVRHMLKDTGGSLLLSTSRRTGDATDVLLETLPKPVHRYLWNDTGDNPYLGYLALSDRIVVTGDSVSMISEACGTGKPVYIFAPPGFVSEKHRRLHERLFAQGFAAPLSDPEAKQKAKRLNAADDIAAAVKKRLLDEIV